jgi:hypothetical protein
MPSISNEKLEIEIINILDRYYKSNVLAKEWYKKKNEYFTYNDKKYSPKEMVDIGKGQEVLEWINLIIGD